MATLQIPPSNVVMQGSHLVPQISFPRPTDASILPPDPERVVGKWVTSFNDLIQKGELDVTALFLEESYWRDLLCLTWDFHTFHGSKHITEFLMSHSHGWRVKSIQTDTSSDFTKPKITAVDYLSNVKCIQSFITVKTDVGKGRGLVRLLPHSDGTWKCYTLFTVLQELEGYGDLNHARRPTSVEYGSDTGRKSWKDERILEENLEGLEPAVIVIGCGQAGLAVAARLKQLGLRSLIVDRMPRVGDNWRNRYHHLVLHDCVWYDHMPYLNFPPHWPIFTPKDKLAEWFELYVKVLELNVWTSTTVKHSEWNADTRAWTIDLEREFEGTKKQYTFHPRHIILATGASGKPSMPSIPGVSSFQGSRLVHSSEFPGLSPGSNGQGKNAVIVGSCNSGHDIAQDYYEHGYNVTMVQRSSTHVVGAQTLIDVTMAGLYCDDGPPVEDADIISHSFPSPVFKRFQVDAANEYTRRDADLLAGLQKANFKLDSGPDGSGLMTKYLSRGGGYYIDTGTSALIASGAIKIKPCSIARINPHSVTFTDGEELEADEVIFATGFGNMRETAGEIFGESVLEKVTDVWGFDEEGETRGMWRKSGHEGFWFFGGNLALCRFYSKALALQIKGLEEGLYRYGD